DRRWMLIDDNNRFLSQREIAKMALLKVGINQNELSVSYLPGNTLINIPLKPLKQDFVTVEIWDDTCTGQLVSDAVDEWFTTILGINCRLVYMPDETNRFTDPMYATEDSITSFSDGYPFLIIGQSSMDELNSRLNDPLSINRFRPNIVFTGGDPFHEDVMNEFLINEITFNGVKLCARCKITTIDQNNAIAGKEPLKTLAKYRLKNNKIFFGQNLIHYGIGTITVGDQLIVKSTHTEDRFIIS
ncbi:MAG: hypothetical protein JWQ79_1803, partial [Mucilaginibacter sp.]|nr:hypothetical protein [Mucilaginibacter sp.]